MYLIDVNIVYLFAALLVVLGCTYSVNNLFNLLISRARNQRVDDSGQRQATVETFQQDF